MSETDSIEWVKIAASLVGGGLAGAILTSVVTSYRNRIQPIGKRIDLTPLFTPGFTGAALRPTVTVSDGTNSHQFTNLHVAELSLVNRGNQDFTTFRFGLTLGERDSCIHAEPTTIDRHHVATLASDVSPASTSSVLDFTLQPFNRGDAYTIKLFIVANGSTPEPIQVSSAEAIRFTDIPSVAETLRDIASTVRFTIGGIEVRIPR